MCSIIDMFDPSSGKRMVLSWRYCPSIISPYRRSGAQNRKQILHCSKKHLSQEEACQQKTKFLSQKLDEIVKWYDEFTGMDEVRKAQNRVLEEERTFRNSQEVRRNILVELNEIQAKIKDLYAELDTVNRGDDKYISLVTMEHKLIKEEKAIMDKFTMAEKNERNAFANLSNSVKLSHEKERAQGERTKYWSIIGSILGTIFGILGTSVNNHFKMNELRELIKTTSDKTLVTNLKAIMENNEKVLDQLKAYIETQKVSEVSPNKDVKLESLLNMLNSKLIYLDELLREKEMKKKFQDSSDQKLVASSTEGNKLLDGNKRNIKVLAYAFAIFSALTLILSKYSS